MSKPAIRLYVPQSLATGGAVTLNESQSHYLLHVMRHKEGDEVAVFNAQDGEWRARIVSLSKKSVSVNVESCSRAPALEPDLWLLFAPVKNDALHTIVEKATELGASKLIPVLTERTIVRHVNQEKLYKNAVEAAEQCERLSVPEVAPLIDLTKILASWLEDRTLIYCDETGQGENARTVLAALTPRPMAVLIGPEGGFTVQEQQRISSRPFAKPVGLGPRILRADTAAIVALAAVQMMLGDWDKRPDFRGV